MTISPSILVGSHDVGGTAPAGLGGFDVLMIGCSPWGLVRSLPEHTAERLARANRVLYVEPFSSLYTQRRLARWQARPAQARSGRRQVAPTLWVYTPPPVAIPGMSRARWPVAMNAVILSRLLIRQMRVLGFDRPLLWTFLYNSGPLVRRVPHRLAVYDCMDNNEALAPTPRRRALVRALEGGLCRAADLVFAVTGPLAEARRPYNPETYEVPCGVDLEYFGRARADSTRVPDDLARLPRPIVGYMGGVDPWKIDVPLLRAVAQARPHWSIALVGYVWCGFDSSVFRGQANIHVLGAKPYESFPGYVKGMDVCLIPFPLNDITRYGDALKCYEYLAAGKPVVSTRVPAAERFPEVVRIADDPATFVSAIDASLEEGPEAADRRVAAVRAHTWDERVVSKSRLIAPRLAACGSGVGP